MSDYIKKSDVRHLLLHKDRDAALAQLDELEAVDAVPVVHGQFVKNETGVNRHCTACGAYLEDREYENHTVRFCYYCGAKMKGDNDAES